MRQTVLVLGGYDRSLMNFRGPLLRAVVQAGHTVIGAAPHQTPEVAVELAGFGVRFVPVVLARTGLNALADSLSLLRLRALFRQERPDLVLSYTIKPVIYGSIAARWAGVPRIYALITGLGAAFYTPGIKGSVLRFITTKLYRLALAQCTKVFVQNQEIGELFIREGIVAAGKTVVVPGSGVDTDHYAFRPVPDGAPVFLLLARMLRDKGVEEYVAAARLTKRQIPLARFLLVGDTDSNPAVISAKQLNEWNGEGVVEYLLAVADVRPLLAQSTVYVLPSYHEGLPRSVLEAMSTGRAVITTDVIGCRDLVFDAGSPDVDGIKWGSNGALVPVRDVKSLAAAMVQLGRNTGLAESMGRKGRSLAKQFFDVHQVNARMLSEMGLAGESSKAPPANSVAV